MCPYCQCQVRHSTEHSVLSVSRDAESFGSFRYTWFAMDGRTEPCAEKGVTLLFKGRSALATVISVIPVRR